MADLTLFSEAVISLKPADGICTFVGGRRRELDIVCLKRCLSDTTLCTTARWTYCIVKVHGDGRRVEMVDGQVLWLV